MALAKEIKMSSKFNNKSKSAFQFTMSVNLLNQMISKKISEFVIKIVLSMIV